MARTFRSDLRALAARAGTTVPGWVGGAMAGLQSALLSVGAIVAVALAVAAASAPADGTAGIDWEAAAAAGVRVWLLAHGVAAGTATASVSLIPLGLTAVFASLAASLARRFAVPTTGSWFAFTATYATCAALIASASDAAATAPHAVVRAALVGALVGGGGAGAGLRRAGWLRGAAAGRFPVWLAAGLRLGVATALGLWAAGAIAFCFWTIAGWAQIAQVAGTLDADPVGTLALSLGEAAYAPTLAVWGVAWLAGPGFSVGAGTEYAPAHLTTVPLPSLPLLGALPHGAGGLLVLAPLVVIAIAAGTRALARRLAEQPSARAQVVAVPTVVVLAAMGAMASRGSLGGGLLASVGPSPVATAIWVGVLVALGFAGGGLAARLTAPSSPKPTSPRSPKARETGRRKPRNDAPARSPRPETPGRTRSSPPP
ncbi:MAG TPA: DUF6350 family protein [Demequinaceae bacterium]